MAGSLLSEILPLDILFKGPDLKISGITDDSRRVRQGYLYAARPGARTHGKRFIREAIARGARVILSRENLALPGGVQGLRARDIKRAFASMVSAFHRHPSRGLLLLGVTGTNGKTTITYLLEKILSHSGFPTAVLGTLGWRFKNLSRSTNNTTPGVCEIQTLLEEGTRQGARACAMEVSSHALDQGRAEACEFDIGIFTNLTQDHLDYHKTKHRYLLAKRRLFESLGSSSHKPYPQCAIMNREDPNWREMASRCRVPVVTCGFGAMADFQARPLRLTPLGSSFEIISREGKRAVRIPLAGLHNVMNALQAAAAARALGVSWEKITQALRLAPQVPGRLESILSGQPFSVYVDYAHTEDALRNVLTTLRALRPKKIITVFGCGGDRDRAKRPKMGAVSARLSHLTILTSDNPRSEEPAQIVKEIQGGFLRASGRDPIVEVDRFAAISRALGEACAGDAVLIAGKGHETTQSFRNKRIYFDDREVARRVLSQLGYARSPRRRNRR